MEKHKKQGILTFSLVVICIVRFELCVPYYTMVNVSRNSSENWNIFEVRDGQNRLPLLAQRHITETPLGRHPMLQSFGAKRRACMQPFISPLRATDRSPPKTVWPCKKTF